MRPCEALSLSADNAQAMKIALLTDRHADHENAAAVSTHTGPQDASNAPADKALHRLHAQQVPMGRPLIRRVS